MWAVLMATSCYTCPNHEKSETWLCLNHPLVFGRHDVPESKQRDMRDEQQWKGDVLNIMSIFLIMKKLGLALTHGWQSCLYGEPRCGAPKLPFMGRFYTTSSPAQQEERHWKQGIWKACHAPWPSSHVVPPVQVVAFVFSQVIRIDGQLMAKRWWILMVANG